MVLLYCYAQLAGHRLFTPLQGQSSGTPCTLRCLLDVVRGSPMFKIRLFVVTMVTVSGSYMVLLLSHCCHQGDRICFWIVAGFVTIKLL